MIVERPIRRIKLLLRSIRKAPSPEILRRMRTMPKWELDALATSIERELLGLRRRGLEVI